MKTLKVTVLVEYHSPDPALVAEHGLALWLEIGSRQILFDTGQGPALTHNARHLGIRLSDADSIILSHGHYDHTGGLAHGLLCENRTWVYAHPRAFEPKYSPGTDGSRYNGMADEPRQRIRRCGELIPAIRPTDLAHGLHLTGPVPRTNDFEDTGGAFFKDPACTVPDDMIDDQAAWFDTPTGAVVILGCAHAGVVNTLRYVRELTEGCPIRAVVGGMHLLHANADRLERTTAALRELSPAELYPCHCTGDPAIDHLRRAFPDAWRPCVTGTIIDFAN